MNTRQSTLALGAALGTAVVALASTVDQETLTLGASATAFLAALGAGLAYEARTAGRRLHQARRGDAAVGRDG